jgi:recombination protein RecA
MAKSKKNNDADFLAEILSETEGETLRSAGQVPYFVDTGNLALNYACSGQFIKGGFPGGRIIEAFGPEASGKSFLGYCFMHAIQKQNGIAILLDCERSSGSEFAERCGHVNPDTLLTYDPITLEEVEKKIIIVTKAIRKKFPDKPIGIVWDSIGVNPSDREWKQVDLPENPTVQQIQAAGGNERPGERAKAANKILRSLNPFLNDNDATLYVINQVRKKIGVMFGNDETTSGGGEALKFYASLRLRCGAPKSFQDKDTKLPIGVNMSVTNKKNRHFTPGVKIENIPLFFNSGINPLGGLMEALLMAKKIEATSKGRYRVLPEWANGEEEAVFQQAKAVPMDSEVLLKYPNLIDAASADEVREYLKEWSEAISLTTSDDIEQIDANTGDIAHLVGNEEEEE